jgi:hypothetical protein
MKRQWTWATAAALAFALVPAAAAQDATGTPTPPPAEAASAPANPDAPPPAAIPPQRKLIESVAVEGTKRASVQRIVVAETRLVPDREYSELEIRDAVRRVKRLPFVLDARPSLRRGTSPGRYALVIEIEENSGYTLTAASSSFEGMEPSGTLAAGFHTFVGGNSRVTASLGAQRFVGAVESSTSLESVNLGFERYDVVGPGSRLELSFSRALGAERTSGAVGLLVPLHGNHSVQLTAGAAVSEQTVFRQITGPWEVVSTDRVTWAHASVGWTFDTTDDRFAPLQGTRAAAGLSHSRRLTDLPSDYVPFEGLDSSTSLSAAISNAAPLARRVSLNTSLHASSFLDAPGESDSYSLGTGASLRYVNVGRRNRSRFFVEAGLNASGLLNGRVLWDGQVAAGFHNKFALIRLSYSQSLNGGL